MVKIDIFCLYIGLFVNGIGNRLAFCVFLHKRRIFIVRIYNGNIAVFHQNRLCLGIIFHGFVIIKMLTGKIGENTYAVVDAVGSQLNESL